MDTAQQAIQHLNALAFECGGEGYNWTHCKVHNDGSVTVAGITTPTPDYLTQAEVDVVEPRLDAIRQRRTGFNNRGVNS